MNTYRFTPHDHTPVKILAPNAIGYDHKSPYVTTAPITYSDLHVSVLIPAGFQLDFASVPRMLHWLYNPVGPWSRAALVHDQLYREGTIHRAVADAIFLDIMSYDRVPISTRYTMYLAVRLFGYFAWRKLRQ